MPEAPPVGVYPPTPLLIDAANDGTDAKKASAGAVHNAAMKLVQTGAAVLMVSHDMELVQQYAKRVLVLTDGKLIGDGETRTIMKDAALLAKAHVLPAQIPELALRLDVDGKGQFVDAYTIDEMYQTILKLLQKGEAV